MTQNERWNILLAEDSATQAIAIRAMLESFGCCVDCASDGEDALQKAGALQPDLIVTDVVMPRMDGFEFCRAVRESESLRSTPVIFLTSLSAPSDILLALESGADAFLIKPVDASDLSECIERLMASQPVRQTSVGSDPLVIEALGRRFELTAGREQILSFLLSTYEVAQQNARETSHAKSELQQLNARLEELVQERTKELNEEIRERQRTEERLRTVLEGTISAISLTTELRDPYTAGHQRRVAGLAAEIARELGWPQERIDLLRMAGLVHDIGKVGLPAEILVKPTRLNEIEYRIIKTHSDSAYGVIQATGLEPIIANAVLQHHERLNGSGYPNALAGADILPEALVLAVADVVEAMASHRPYREALGLERALEELRENSGELYSPEVVEACIRICMKDDFDFESLP